MRNSKNCAEVSKFAEDVCIGSGITIPDILTTQVVLFWRAPVTSSLTPTNRDERRYSLRDSSNGTKRGKILGVILWRNC